jgi:hypothetical protein
MKKRVPQESRFFVDTDDVCMEICDLKGGAMEEGTDKNIFSKGFLSSLFLAAAPAVVGSAMLMTPQITAPVFDAICAAATIMVAGYAFAAAAGTRDDPRPASKSFGTMAGTILGGALVFSMLTFLGSALKPAPVAQHTAVEKTTVASIPR